MSDSQTDEFNVKTSDKKRREFILTGNLWAVVLKISLPLMLVNALNFLYNIIDSVMAANIDSTAISAVVVLGQISNMIMSLGAGFASGGMIIISRLIGRKNYITAKTVANTVLILAAAISLITIGVVVPLTPIILRLTKTPDSLIQAGSEYFIVQIITVGVMLFNSVFLGLEKSRGQTKNILYLNLAIVTVKILLSYLFAYVFNFGITMIAGATLIANLMLTVLIVIVLSKPKYFFRFELKNRDFSKEFLKPILILSFPIFLGKFVFSLGKVVINAMCAHYGDKVVGSLGVSNNLGGYVTNVIGSVEESESLIISTNLGQKNKKRALTAFYYSLILNVGIALVGVTLMTVFNEQIVGFYSKGDKAFGKMISDIYAFEKLGIVALAVNSSMLGLLYGFGFTKVCLITNLSRLFVFRIPSLYLLINFTNLGSESVGIAMLVSNGGIGLMSVVITIIYLLKIKRQNLTDELKMVVSNQEFI